mmetsp:Transcript_36168/g.87295  ORF Transcript_36168/g.87295 Transcript_36168/m.87295 type:complete len:1009 (-) Transcript_36168:436-3462(-)
MSSALLSSEQGLVATNISEDAPTFSFKFNSNKENKPFVSSPPSQVSRVITKESLQVADEANRISSSPPLAAANFDTTTSNSEESSLFEFGLFETDNNESELLSLPLTSIELPLTPPPLITGSDSFESCAATLLTPAVSESDSSSALSTAAAIVSIAASQQQPQKEAALPPALTLSIRAPPIVSVAAQLPVVSPKLKPKKAPTTARARSNSKTNGKKATARQQRPPTKATHAPVAPPTSVFTQRLTSSTTNGAMEQPPPTQPRAPTVPTPATIAAPAAATAPPRPAMPTLAPQAPFPKAMAGGQPLPPAAVAGRKYTPAPQANPIQHQYAPMPAQPASRPRTVSNARAQPAPIAANGQVLPTSNTVSAISPTTGQVENTGRWTAEEHRLFLQGLEQHGKGWKKIATLIKSRTVVQIRTHAQKYFQKLAKARQNGEATGMPGVAVAGAVAISAGGVIPVGTAEGDGTIGIAIPVGADGQPVVTMRTTAHATSAHHHHSGNMSLGHDATSVAAAQGQVGIAAGGLPQAARGGRKRRNAVPGGGTKRRVIGNVVRSAVREGRNIKRQKMAQISRKVAPVPTAAVSASAPAAGALPSASRPAAVSSALEPANEEFPVPNPLPSVSSILDPYVTSTMGMPPPPAPAPGTVAAQAQAKKKGGQRGRQQMVHTATHGTLPMAALEDAVFRLLTPATGAPSPPMPGTQPSLLTQPHSVASNSIVDPLAPQPTTNQAGKIPIAHTQYSVAPVPAGYPQGILPNSSPTGVAEMSLLPSWVDAKNPPAWFNEGGDIDTLLEDAECLNWLSDTGDFEETYPPTMAEPTVVSSSSTAVNYDVEPTPVLHESGGVVHPSAESLSFLVDAPENHSGPTAVSAADNQAQAHHVACEELHQLPAFLEEAAEAAVNLAECSPEVAAMQYASATEAVQAVHEADPIVPEHRLAGVGESDTNLMGFPDLDMGDEQAFVSALLENSGQSTMSFPKLGSDVHMHANGQSGVALSEHALSSVTEEGGLDQSA